MSAPHLPCTLQNSFLDGVLFFFNKAYVGKFFLEDYEVLSSKTSSPLFYGFALDLQMVDVKQFKAEGHQYLSSVSLP